MNDEDPVIEDVDITEFTHTIIEDHSVSLRNMFSGEMKDSFDVMSQCSRVNFIDYDKSDFNEICKRIEDFCATAGRKFIKAVFCFNQPAYFPDGRIDYKKMNITEDREEKWKKAISYSDMKHLWENFIIQNITGIEWVKISMEDIKDKILLVEIYANAPYPKEWFPDDFNFNNYTPKLPSVDFGAGFPFYAAGRTSRSKKTLMAKMLKFRKQN